MHRLIAAAESNDWNTALAHVGEFDASCLAAYHLAYALRIAGSSALLWHFSEGGEHFVYPFLLTAVEVDGVATGHTDISSIYGYTGPLATTADTAFIAAAWEAFDGYARTQKAVAEFVRFSPFNRNEGLAHPRATVLPNRDLAVSILPGSEDGLLGLLGPKTRNMLRKAERAGLTARELALPDYLPAFRALYAETMRRNSAPAFFHYDDAYWQHLLALGPLGLRLFGAFAGSGRGTLVAAAMGIAHGASGLYHLGASLPEHARLGAGNLSLYAMSCGLMAGGARFLNITGGRTPAADDPLLLFKRNNATTTATFYIGRRIVDSAAYNEVAAQWQRRHGVPPDPAKVIFWR